MVESKQVDIPAPSDDAVAVAQPLETDDSIVNPKASQKSVTFHGLDDDDERKVDKTVNDEDAAKETEVDAADDGNDEEGGEDEMEEIEEEYEEEIDDPDAEVAEDEERPKIKIKKTRKVKRKKKVKPPEPEVEKVADASVQMPAWTEALEIEYMSQEQLSRTIAKLREEGLSETDIRLGEDLHYRRSVFKVDQFVKLCEVREIVKAALNSIMDKMRKNEETNRKNRTEIIGLDTKTKTLQQQVTHLKRIENAQTSLIRMQREQELKLQDISCKVDDWRYEAQIEKGEKEAFNKEMANEITKCKALTDRMELRCKTLEEKQVATSDKFVEFIDEQKAFMDIEFQTLKNKFEELPAKMEQNLMQVEAMNKEIKIKQSRQFEQIMETLTVDANRLVTIETELKEMKVIDKRTEQVEKDIVKLKKLEDQVFQAHCFIERTLPMVVHHQLCEGLNVIAGPNLAELLQFEKKKTDEVYEHSKLCEGRRPNIRKLRMAHEKFTENAWKYKIGAAPFIYGENKDYWVDMKKFIDYDKRMYAETRHLRTDQKLKDIEAARKAQMEEHMEYLFMAERDTTKLLIEKEIKSVKMAGNMRGGMSRMMRQAHASKATKSDESKQSVASPRQENYQPSEEVQVRRIPEKLAKKKVSSQSIGREPSHAPKIVTEDVSPILAVDQQNHLDISCDQSMMDMSAYDGHDSRMMKEMKIVNSVQIIRKVDRAQLSKLKKKASAFMIQGRTEFCYQLEKWQEFFDETQEDYCEMQNKVEELEQMVEMMSDQLVELQERTPVASKGGVTDSKDLPDFQTDLENNDGVVSMQSADTSVLSKLADAALARRVTMVEGGAKATDSPMNKMTKKQRSMSMVLRNKRQSKLDKQILENNLGEIQEKVEEVQSKSSESSIQLSQSNAGDLTLSQQSSHVRYSQSSVGQSVITKKQPTLKQQATRKSVVANKVQENKRPPKLDSKSVTSQEASQITSPSRKSRLNKLENTQQRLQSRIGGAKLPRVMSPLSQSSATPTTSSAGDISDLNATEKQENSAFMKKQAGNTFFFARGVNRTTMSRSALTDLVKDIFEKLTKKTDQFQLIANDRYDNIIREKEHMKEQNSWFQEKLTKDQSDFSAQLEDKMKKKGLEMQELLLTRINENEDHVESFETRLSVNIREIQQMADRLDQEYTDFVNNRRRWKGDFIRATEQAYQNIDTIREMLSGCERQNQVNTIAVKNLLDAQMIEQLVQRQDVADRQQVLGLAFKKDQELMSTDLGTHTSQINGPKINHKQLKHDALKTDGKTKLKLNTDSANKQRVSTMKSTEGEPSSIRESSIAHQGGAEASILRDFEANASRIDPPVLRVDRNCLNCAENKSKTLNAFKVACLTHTQSPIPYQGREYHVSDLLTVKAKIVAQCQRILNENLFNTDANTGIDIRNEDNEKSFVIQPLSDVQAIKVETRIQDLLKKNTTWQGSSPMFRSWGQHHLTQEDDDASKNTTKTNLMQGHEESVNFTVVGERAQFLSQDQDDYPSHQIYSKEKNIKGQADDLFSSNAQLTTPTASIHINTKIQRGTSQLSQHKDQPEAFSRTGLNQMRFSSQQKMQNLPTEKVQPRRQQFFESTNYIETGGAHFPDVQAQRHGNKKSNKDFDHIFESTSTKNSQMRQSSVTGTSARNNAFARTGMTQSSRYGGASTRLGRSVALDKDNSSGMAQPIGSMEDSYRATDGFRNIHKQKLTQKKHSELLNGLVNRPQTQENAAGLGTGVKRGIKQLKMSNQNETKN